MEHFVSKCSEVRERFRELGVCKEERLVRIWSDLDRKRESFEEFLGERKGEKDEDEKGGRYCTDAYNKG